MVEILKGAKIEDLALWLPKKKTLVIADLHIGFEEALNKEGVLVPKFQYKIIKEKLERLLKKLHPFHVVLNGDLKHEFGTISAQEWREALNILELIERYCKNITLIRGNHDTIIGPIAKKKNVKIVDHIVVGEFYVTHGHQIPVDAYFRKAKNVIIGHEHPAISLREGGKVEKFKCFLKGEFENKNIVVVPSFNFVNEGSDLLNEKQLSPFLQRNLGKFSVFIVFREKVYNFKTLGDIKENY